MTPPDAPAAAPAAAARHPAPPDPHRGPPRGALATARKYHKIFRASLVERMTYRGDFLFGTILRFLPLVTTILLWNAIYKGVDGGTMGGRKAVFTFREMIAYLLLTNISRMFSSMPGLAGGIARDIRDGSLKRYMIQPVDLIGYLLAYRAAHKVAYIVISSLPYGLLFFVFARLGYFDGFPDAPTMAAYVLSLVLAFLVGFYFEACVGMVGFWFLEVTSLLYIVMTLNFFISGHMLPLDLLPEPWSSILKMLPFQYMAYFPAVVFQGKVKGNDLVFHLVLELAWALAFMVLARLLYRLGLKRYSAYGG